MNVTRAEPGHRLMPGQIDVWAVDALACQDAALLAAYADLMSPAERQRNERFVFERDRRSHLITRALVRSVLGRCVGAPPASLVFEAGEHGKPRLVRSAGMAGPVPFFNLAHCHGCVVLAVSPDGEVGIDVEEMSRPAPLEIAAHQFSRMEVQALTALPAPAQDERFWALWTLKESLIKADGHGLHQALDSFGFDLDVPGRIALSVFAEADRRRLGGPWWFGQWRPSLSHMAAICAARQGGAVPALRLHQNVPLRHEQPGGLSLVRVSDSDEGVRA